jgi:hypothetical protein
MGSLNPTVTCADWPIGIRRVGSTGTAGGDDTVDDATGCRGDSHAAVTNARQRAMSQFHDMTASRYQGAI